jgi:hypothetical protein
MPLILRSTGVKPVMIRLTAAAISKFYHSVSHVNTAYSGWRLMDYKFMGRFSAVFCPKSGKWLCNTV